MPDPFETLGVEPRFDLDRAALEARHRELSKALHPDRYTGSPAAERRMALGRAIDVNEAFRALRDPIRRAEALLAREGVSVGERGEPRAAPALLMEMMELREELSLAGGAKDLAAVAVLAERMRAREEQTQAHLGALLDSARGAPQKLAGALPVLGELRYIRRFLDEVNAIEEELSP
jgi:molecular chaperone HscB